MFKKKRNRILFYIFSAFLLLNVIIIFSGNAYLYKAFYYLKANIDDYKIFENRKINTGTFIPIPDSKNKNKSVLSADFKEYLEKSETVAFLVIKNDSVVHEEYWDGYGSGSYSNSFSIAKSITSILVGIAIDEGKIKNVDQKVSDFIPEYSHDFNAKLTIKHLLTMSSAIEWDESYDNPLSITTKAYYGNNITDIVLNLKVLETPGKYFNYQSCNSLVLAYIIKKATGMNLSEYASEKLWKPLGAKNDALWCLDKEDGTEKAYCCFNSDARDFARIGLLYLHRGVFNNKRIISENYVAESTTSADLEEIGKPKINFYGYSWWLTAIGKEKVFYARGILGQFVIVVPAKNMVIVRLGKINMKKDEKLAIDVILESVINKF